MLFRAKKPPEVLAQSKILRQNIVVNTSAGPAQVHIKPHSRAARLRLAVKRDGSGFRLTIPQNYGQKRAVAWANDQADWMAQRMCDSVSQIQVADGANIPVRGVDRRIMWNATAARAPLLDMAVLHVGGPAQMVPRRIGRFLKDEARVLLDAETRACAHLAGVEVNAISVADPKSRWGSCAAAGHIRYSWRLILMPDLVRQSIVAHEVAHLVHMNHSREFHALADQLFTDLSKGAGDPRAARRWLRAHGNGLQRYIFTP
jgi:predicted metal-dependent hydrolase